MNSFYNNDELSKLGLKHVGKNVLISRHVSIYGAERISIGNNVRIDDFCILSGNIILHDYIHIAAYCCLFGGSSGIEMFDYTGISSRCAIYAETDDYSGYAMTNPMVPERYRNIIGGKVSVGKHAIVGSGCTILPNLCIGEGVAVGSMSLVSKSLASWGLYVGIPCRRIKDRNKRVLKLEEELCNDSGCIAC